MISSERYYELNLKFGVAVLEGTQWKAVFEYTNGHKAVEFSGNNDYPYNFSQFMELFELDGGKDTNKYTV